VLRRRRSRRRREVEAGLPDFLDTIYQNGKNIPNDHKIYQIAVK
jgi:hypothetical protein